MSCCELYAKKGCNSIGLGASAPTRFAAKYAHVIGLCLNPPHNALVLSVDEKPSIQAIERTCGYVHTSSSKIVCAMKSAYQRQGTLTLFAALQVARGRFRARSPRHRSAGLSGIPRRGDSTATRGARDSYYSE